MLVIMIMVMLMMMMITVHAENPAVDDGHRGRVRRRGTWRETLKQEDHLEHDDYDVEDDIYRVIQKEC